MAPLRTPLTVEHWTQLSGREVWTVCHGEHQLQECSSLDEALAWIERTGNDQARRVELRETSPCTAPPATTP